MRIAVFSDIHSNQEALRAFMEHAARQGIDRYVCLGDLVGYGANPNRCIDLVQSLPGISFIKGNHDNAATGNTSNMNTRADKSMAWTRQRLSGNNIIFLKKMDTVIKQGNLTFCHATPYNPLTWAYITKRKVISKTFARSRAKIIFTGHTHAPSAITRKNFFCVYIKNPKNNSVLPAATQKRQIFNCGSIGQPRDGDPRASYLIYDAKAQLIEFHRVPYDHDKAARKIMDAGLPHYLATRLLKGE
ncbi:Predicted phosphodiesterase [Desulfocicer vacuolatum DSM 3385]|uniref:Predicted phosphodiesterase n=1 Tax=Desulfocicer vacuolatum DSM 3385 TaxID=1121400 RepID=A0A1W2EDX7_9BACT|nr:metallophosphoesterase family protein [Desulfocicer vacuolatum]SMD07602.1 Predicted phosphodiesterase [Desulfocicer vacuolatum DSM 3385]